MVDLQELAEILKCAPDLKAYFDEGFKEFRYAVTLGGDPCCYYFEYWNGEGESPALCFAMLGILRQAEAFGISLNDENDPRYWIAGLPAQHLAKPWTLLTTERVAAAVIECHKAGLLSADVTVQGGGAQDA